MKKIAKGAGISAIILLLTLIIGYCLLGVYYLGGFPCFTWINGVYCTGKSVSEVNEELCRLSAYDGIGILDSEGATLYVSAEDVGYSIDYTKALQSVFNDRNPLAWGVYLFKSMNYQYEPAVTLDKDKLSQVLNDWEIFVDPNDFECSIVRSDTEGYVLENAYVTVPVKEKVTDRVYDAMLSREKILDLSYFKDCYKDVDLRSSEKEKIALFNKIEDLQNFDISYTVDSEVVNLDKNIASTFILTEKDLEEAVEEKTSKSNPGLGKFIIAGEEKELPDPEELTVLEGIVLDTEGNPILSESKMYGFLSEVAESHDTSWMMEQYRQGTGHNVIINNSSRGDGFIFDVVSEFDHLKDEAVTGAKSHEEREFQLSDSAVTYNADEEIGRTYIEINMGEQMLYYYVDGMLSMNMPIVTGNVNRGRGTPTGIYPVYNKRYHTNLVGVDYVSYVNYWLGVHKGVGIHDALWRSKFGDEIYKSDGSHGCINCPLETVEKLWEVVDVGTPVVLYY